jgi:hypothetical protein
MCKKFLNLVLLRVMEEAGHAPFYGADIIRRKEHELIEAVLAKFKKEPVNEDLKKKIYEALHEEKVKGNLKIPFKVILKQDPSGKFAPYVEILLDTKV